jgi:hypothetical protein
VTLSKTNLFGAARCRCQMLHERNRPRWAAPMADAITIFQRRHEAAGIRDVSSKMMRTRVSRWLSDRFLASASEPYAVPLLYDQEQRGNRPQFYRRNVK